MRSLRKGIEHGCLCLYFQVHQPRRLRRFGFFDIGKSVPYFDEENNREITRRVAKTCYMPANEMLLALIRRFPQIRLVFSISGVAVDQFKKYSPEVIESFKRLAATGSVEFLCETYYHSLACQSDVDEFIRQIEKHRAAIEDLFGKKPSVFRNTELIYSDEVGRIIHKMGFKGIFADGIESILQYRSPDYLYEHIEGNGLKVLMRNYTLSDDIAFRFSNRDWKEWPLTAEKYVKWLQSHQGSDRLITLGLDYETFGEHQKAETGIFHFLKDILTALSKNSVLRMVTPSEAIALLPSKGLVSSPTPVSWADRERDLSAWLGNDLQRDAYDNLKSLGVEIAKVGDGALRDCWKYLQTSDHFYYMSTKKGDDGRVHNYFSPYSSPYEAFINYMNVLSDMSYRVKRPKKAAMPPPRTIGGKFLRARRRVVA